ncbi:hypothetical protein CDAR_293921 [Caerostris darwini]|uniref:Uncharacterized protein n=1 Tax=Caerostris darwini TaxID=1538125 RepID=A0AAV4VFI8_9ARAC|nr:hypothetical protein CDAR_293921 [Caerostris darwini]
MRNWVVKSGLRVGGSLARLDQLGARHSGTEVPTVLLLGTRTPKKHLLTPNSTTDTETMGRQHHRPPLFSAVWSSPSKKRSIPPFPRTQHLRTVIITKRGIGQK